MALLVGAAEGAASAAVGDDLGAVFAVAGVMFDTAEITYLALNGMRASANSIGLVDPRLAGTSMPNFVDALPVEIDKIGGEVLASSRAIANPAETFTSSGFLPTDLANAVDGLVSTADAERGIAMALVAQRKTTELVATGVDPTEASQLVTGLQTHAVNQLSEEAQAAYRTLTETLASAPAGSVDEFVDDLVGGLTLTFASPSLNVEEMTALYRASSPDQSLTDADLQNLYDSKLRYDPDSPTVWPRLSDLVCQSFSGDTQVLLATGHHKPISEIEIGDMVVSTNPDSGRTESKPVTAIWPHQDTLVDLVVDGGSITTTEDHHFWNVTDQRWQESQLIDMGDQLLQPSGATTSVIGLDWTTTQKAQAFDLTVEDFHSYYVFTGSTDVLVHNCNVTGKIFLGNTVEFTLDADGYTTKMYAEITNVGTGLVRSAEELYEQRTLFGKIAGDHAGHLGAFRFLGNQGGMNLLPMNGNLNTSAFKKLENEIADFVTRGAKVEFTVEPQNIVNGRPDAFAVKYTAVDVDTGLELHQVDELFFNQTGEEYLRLTAEEVDDKFAEVLGQ